jgi:hypothetical protein
LRLSERIAEANQKTKESFGFFGLPGGWQCGRDNPVCLDLISRQIPGLALGTDG